MPSHSEPVSRWLLWLSVVFALMLTIMPLPHWATSFRPEWVLLALLVWAFETPQQVGVGIAFIAGILLALVQDSTLGLTALAMMVPLFFAYRLSQRARQFPLWQLSGLVFLLLSAYALLNLWLLGLSGEPVAIKNAALSVVSSAILWPFLFIFTCDLRTRLS